MNGINIRCRRSSCFLVICIGLLITQLQAVCRAQETKPRTEAEIRALIKKTFEKNTEKSNDARNVLLNLDSDSLPVLTSILGKPGDLCERVEAAQILVGIYLQYKQSTSPIVPPLAEIVISNSGPAKSRRTVNCRHVAFDLLMYSPDGIRALTELMNHKSLFVRQNALSAFNECLYIAMGVLVYPQYPEGYIEAIKEAFPVIAGATRESDKIIKDTAYEILSNWSDTDSVLTEFAEAELKKLPKQTFGNTVRRTPL